jgi:hypothetical protein
MSTLTIEAAFLGFSVYSDCKAVFYEHTDCRATFLGFLSALTVRPYSLSTDFRGRILKFSVCNNYVRPYSMSTMTVEAAY